MLLAVQYALYSKMTSKINLLYTTFGAVYKNIMNLTIFRFQSHAKKFSSMMQDKIISGETFTNHVINKIVRARNAWPLVKAAKKLNLFQYFCLDIVFTFFCFVVLAVFIFFKLLICIYRLMK